MADRFPLIIDSSTNRILELPTTDNLDLSSSNISNVTNITSVGNITAVNLTGTLTTVAQPNITSVGTLTSLAVSGVANLANVNLVAFDENVASSANTGSSISPNVSASTIFNFTANSNFTFNTLTNALAGSSATVIITQDATGNRLLTSTMKFAGGVKTLSTAASAIDIICVFYDGTSYYAALSKSYA
jgi:hypothetical protein